MLRLHFYDPRHNCLTGVRDTAIACCVMTGVKRLLIQTQSVVWLQPSGNCSQVVAVPTVCFMTLIADIGAF